MIGGFSSPNVQARASNDGPAHLDRNSGFDKRYKVCYTIVIMLESPS